MNDKVSEIVYSFFKQRIPLIFSLFLIFLFYMPLDLFEISGLRPQLGFICVYYWIQKRPQMFGLISAFIIGITVDICSTTPLGINCLLLMAFSLALSGIFRYVKPTSFQIDWLFFSLSETLISLSKWLILIFYFQKIVNVSTIFMNGFSTIMFYPLIAYFNDLVQKNLLPQEGINE